MADETDDRWTIRGVPKETREAAIKAAHRAAVSVGIWACQAFDRALQAEREPMDLLAPEAVTPAPGILTLDVVERVVSAAAVLANAERVPTRLRSKANRLLREALPDGARVRKAPKPEAPIVGAADHLLAAPEAVYPSPEDIANDTGRPR